MKKSKLFRTLTLAVAAALCMATTTVTAYAGGADPDPVPLPETTEAPAEVPEETEEPTTGGMEPEGVPVTPEGNATLWMISTEISSLSPLPPRRATTFIF